MRENILSKKTMKNQLIALGLNLLSVKLALADITESKCKEIDLSGKKFALILDTQKNQDDNIAKFVEFNFLKEAFKPKATDEDYTVLSTYKIKIKLTPDIRIN